jgi:hypothetical protein
VADLRQPVVNQIQDGTMHADGQARGTPNRFGFTTSARGHIRGGFQAHQQNTRGGFKYDENDFPDEEFKIGRKDVKECSNKSQQSDTSQVVTPPQMNQQVSKDGQRQANASGITPVN